MIKTLFSENTALHIEVQLCNEKKRPKQLEVGKKNCKSFETKAKFITLQNLIKLKLNNS